MANSSLAGSRKPIYIFIGVALAAAVIFGIGRVMGRGDLLELVVEPDITPHTVVYRYHFGGEVLTHYLDQVDTVTIYRRSGEDTFDQAVFNLHDGRDYVLNGDILVDYELPQAGDIELIEKIDQLYHHYDPYLQGYKQDLHEQWVDEQYQGWAGREATDDEWLEALNELTRGVEHHQMERWIRYSPPAIAYFLDNRLGDLSGRELSDQVRQHVNELLLQGIDYEDIEEYLAGGNADK